MRARVLLFGIPILVAMLFSLLITIILTGLIYPLIMFCGWFCFKVLKLKVT